MASRKKQKQKLQAKHAQQTPQRPSQRLDEAQGALLSGKTTQAIELATKALNANLDAGLRARGLTILVEALFRAAAATPLMEQRLAHLESAIRLNPQQARLHHHAGATLLHLRRADAAAQAFHRALALEPKRPGLRFLYQLARVMNGEAEQIAELTEAEVNSLHLAHALLQGDMQADLNAQFVGKPLVGQADGLWQHLLQMAGLPKSAPVVSYFAQRAAAPQLKHSSIAAYYAGVVALRKGDRATALPIWRQLASEQSLSTTWFKENSALLMREHASALADAQRWQEVVDLQPSDEEIASDNVLAEVVAAAHFRLGHDAADANQWAQAVHHWQEANRLAKDRRSAQNLALAQERLGRWNEAAAAWREMVRRRPRKSDHPNSLTDDQVSAIWQHAADCYAQVGNSEEEIACVKNALKYRETDPDLRMRLVDAYLNEDRIEAARNELERLLESAPDHVKALTRLGMLYQMYKMGDAMPLWQRVLALEPANEDAKNALAACYVELSRAQTSSGWLGRLLNRTPKQKIKILQDGLKELPGHPFLLLELGKIQHASGDQRAAQSSLRQAWEASPADPNIVGSAIHELLHAKGDKIVEEILPSTRAIPGLLAAFWLSQAEQANACKLGDHWTDRFFEEALAQSALRLGDDSPTLILMHICDTLFSEELSDALKKKWEARARAEAGNSGLNEYIDARYAVEAGNMHRALESLRKGRLLASKAKETKAADYFQQIENLLSRPRSTINQLLDQFDEDEDFMEILRQMERLGKRRRR